ncbi:MAG TPA: hypothetical protein VN915_13515 [Elusimicrobiota bacterium]|nr:hypothetical protein [Elusimicrobiota bacterium]
MSDLYLAASGAGAPPPEGAVPLCFTWEAHARFTREGIAAPAWEDMIPAAQAGPLMAWTLGLADSWHQDGAGDATDFDGYSLARVFRWLLWVQTLHPAYKFLTALSAAFELHRPQTIHFEGSVPLLYQEVLGRSSRAFGFRPVEHASAERAGGSHVWTPPQASHSRPKLLAGAIFNSAAFADKGKREWIFSYYHSLENFVGAARRGGSAVTFADFPPLKRLPALLGKASVLLGPALTPRPSAPDEARLESLIARWDQLRSSADYDVRFEWKGVSLRSVVEPVLDELVRRQFRSWSWACRQLDEHWTRRAPALVLLPFPGPPFQQALQLTAQRHGTPTAVVLHGLPFSYSFPLELPQGGHFLAWGPEQERLYEGNPFRTGCRIACVGNPNFDRYAGRRVERTGALRRVLLLTHPVAHTTPLSSDLDPARHIRRAAEVLKRFPGLNLTVRLHPSESIEYYRRLLADVAPGAAVLKGGRGAARLDRNDVVIGAFSTVLLEGILLGLPVAALNFSRDEFPPPFDGRCGVPLLRSAAELDAFLRSSQDDPTEFRRSTCARHDEIIARFAGRVDGKATARATEYLESLATRSDAI